MTEHGARVLWLTQNHPPSRGGMARSSDRVVRGLRRRGLTVDVAHLSPRHTREQAHVREGGHDLIVPLDADPAHAVHLLGHALTRHAFRPGLLAVFGGQLPMTAGPVLAALHKIPFVIFLRGNDLDVALFHPARQGLLERALHQAALVVVLSEDHRRKVLALVPGAKVVRIENGIDTDAFTPSAAERARARERHPPGRRVLGVVGQLKEKKGVRFLLEALQTSAVADRVHVHLVGDLSETLQSWLSTSAGDLSFTHAAFLDPDEMLGVYPGFDAVALPSFYDGMPNVLLEACAASVPLLAATAGAMPDVLVDGRESFLFTPGDAHGCRHALARFVDAGDARLAEMATAARALATTFTHERESLRIATALGAVAAGDDVARALAEL